MFYCACAKTRSQTSLVVSDEHNRQASVCQKLTRVGMREKVEIKAT